MILLPVSFDSANRRKDKSVSLKFSTAFEVSTDDFSEMDRLVQSMGWLAFRDNEFDPSQLPTEDAPIGETKPKIQRLRAVLFLIWRDKTDQSVPFQTWWDSQFEKLLSKYKEQLD